MKKNVIIFCVFAALAMLFASCKGGGGGDSKDSTTTTTDNAAGAWINETGTINSGLTIYEGLYFSDGKVYTAITKDKSTIYYINDTVIATYTNSGNTITMTASGNTDNITINNGTISSNSITYKKYTSAKIESRTSDEVTALMLSWLLNP